MTKQLLFGGTLLLVFAGSFPAQEPGLLAGKVTLKSSGEGIPEVSIALCPDTGPEMISMTEGGRLPARGQIQSIRIPSAGEPGQITITGVFTDCPDARRTTTDK